MCASLLVLLGLGAALWQILHIVTNLVQSCSFRSPWDMLPLLPAFLSSPPC